MEGVQLCRSQCCVLLIKQNTTTTAAAAALEKRNLVYNNTVACLLVGVGFVWLISPFTSFVDCSVVELAPVLCHRDTRKPKLASTLTVEHQNFTATTTTTTTSAPAAFLCSTKRTQQQRRANSTSFFMSARAAALCVAASATCGTVATVDTHTHSVLC